MKMAEKIMDDLKESYDEISGRFNNSIWKDYLLATGELFSSNKFVEKSQEDSTQIKLANCLARSSINHKIKNKT